MDTNLPRGWEDEAQAALGDEVHTAGSQIRADPASTETSLILVTATRFLHVTRAGTRSWPVATVGVAEVQEYTKSQHGGLTVLTVDAAGDAATDEIHRFVATNGDAAYGCELVADELQLHTHPAIATRIAELSWWEAKPAWPQAALGRAAGGTLDLTPGRELSVGIGRRGVSLYDPGQAAPFLQIPWPDVTGLTVEVIDELKHRLGPSVVTALGLPQWRFRTRGLRGKLGLEAFIGISTKSAEFYVAAKASARDLRQHWDSVLSRFELEPDEALLSALSTDPAPTDKAAPRATQRNVVEELERLSALREAGALTDAEYAAAKASILGRTQ